MEAKLRNKNAQEERDNARNRTAEESQETADETKDEKVNEENALEKKDLRRKRGKRKLNYCYRPEKIKYWYDKDSIVFLQDLRYITIEYQTKATLHGDRLWRKLQCSLTRAVPMK